jgi:hypothetical protein
MSDPVKKLMFGGLPWYVEIGPGYIYSPYDQRDGSMSDKLREDDEITVHRPGRDDVTMPWGQWVGNVDRYEAAGFTWSVRAQPTLDAATRPTVILKSNQGACSDDERPEAWGDGRLIQELNDLFRRPEDFDVLSSGGEFDYRKWARGFVRSVKDQSSLTEKQRESTIKLIRTAWR